MDLKCSPRKPNDQLEGHHVYFESCSFIDLQSFFPPRILASECAELQRNLWSIPNVPCEIRGC